MTKPRPDSIGFLVADLSRLMRRAFEQGLESSSLTLAQARALIHVARKEGLRQVELANVLEVQPITLARLIYQLEADGLVERVADPQDRRAWRLYLTTAAAPHLEAIDQAIAAVRRRTLRGMSEQQIAMLSSALETMRGNLAPASRTDNEEAK